MNSRKIWVVEKKYWRSTYEIGIAEGAGDQGRPPEAGLMYFHLLERLPKCNFEQIPQPKKCRIEILEEYSHFFRGLFKLCKVRYYKHRYVAELGIGVNLGIIHFYKCSL